MPCSTKHTLAQRALWAILLLSPLLFFSCSSSHEGTGEEPRTLLPTAGFGNGTQTVGQNFQQGDIVWAWADRYGTNDGYIKAWKLTATGVNGEFESPYKKYWPKDFSDLRIQAFHGDFDDELVEGVTPLSSLSHTISTDQSVEANCRRSDLLYAVLSPANYKSRLLFLHMLSKIKIILQDTEDVGGVAETSITNADMSLNNVATTVRLDMATRQAMSDAPYADINLGTTTADNHTAEAIIPPQQVDSGKPFFELILHDFPRKDSVRTFHFVAPSEGLTFEPGKEYVYTLSVKNLIKVKPVDIPLWDWKNVENTLEWSKFFFAVMVMDWNGLTEYSHQWAFINFSPTTEEWDGQEHTHQWSWIFTSPQVDGWVEKEQEIEIPKNSSSTSGN